MVDGEQSQQPEDIERLLNIFKQMLGSVHDQVGAVRGEALDTANAALNLAAKAELNSENSTRKHEEVFTQISETLGKHVQWTGTINDFVLDLSKNFNQILRETLIPLLNTLGATQSVHHEWMMTMSTSMLILSRVFQIKDQETAVQAAMMFFKVSGEFSDLMTRAIWVEDVETKTKLLEEAHTTRVEYLNRIAELVGIT